MLFLQFLSERWQRKQLFLVFLAFGFRVLAKKPNVAVLVRLAFFLIGHKRNCVNGVCLTEIN